MKIPDEVKQFFESVPVMAFSTTNKNGTPNVVAIAFKRILDDATIWVLDTHFKKTKENILQNNKAAIAFWSKEEKRGYQIKGVATYHSEGKLFEEAVNWAKLKGKGKPTKGVVEIKVTEVYSITPSYEEAGKRIA